MKTLIFNEPAWLIDATTYNLLFSRTRIPLPSDKRGPESRKIFSPGRSPGFRGRGMHIGPKGWDIPHADTLQTLGFTLGLSLSPPGLSNLALAKPQAAPRAENTSALQA